MPLRCNKHRSAKLDTGGMPATYYVGTRASCILALRVSTCTRDVGVGLRAKDQATVTSTYAITPENGEKSHARAEQLKAK